MKKPTAYVSRSGHKLSLNCDELASNSGFAVCDIVAKYCGFYSSVANLACCSATCNASTISSMSPFIKFSRL